MAAPTLEFVEGERAPLVLGDGELTVEKIKLTRDSLGGTWAEPTDGATVTHNGRPLEGRARLADGDVLQVGATRLRYALPEDDWTAVSDPPDGLKAPAPPLPPTAAPLVPPTSAPLPMPPPSATPLPSLADDFDSPQTQQMSPEEVKRLTQGASKPIPVPVVSDGPEALPPPPVGETPTGPALVLPPPVSATAKSRLASAFGQTMLPDPDFGSRVPPPPPMPASDTEPVTGTIEISGVREMSEVSGVEVTSGVSEVSGVETTTGVLREPTTGVHGDTGETTTGVLGEPATGVHGESAETRTGVHGESSAITVPRDPDAQPEVTRPSSPFLLRLDSSTGPVTGPTNVLKPPERLDPTTQPSLQSIDLPSRDGAGRRARKFLRALLASSSVRGVLIADLAWAFPFAALLGWVTTHTGDAWMLACAGGVTLLAITTFVAAARVAPKVSGLTLASARGQLAVGVSADVVAVGRLRAWVAVPIVAGAIGVLALAGRTLGGVVGFFVLMAALFVFDAWLRSAYTACFAAWARACARAQSLDVNLAPTPLAKAFEP